MPVPFQFDDLDVLRTFLSLGTEPMSRSELVEQLGIGEGSLKTILSQLKQKKLVTSTRAGHSLSPSGEKHKAQLLTSLSLPIDVTLSMYPELKKVALLVKNPTQKVSYIHRDLAVKYGADGALLFQCHKGALTLPYGETFEFEELKSLFPYAEGDVLIVTFGKEKNCLVRAALALAQKLCSLSFTQEII